MREPLPDAARLRRRIERAIERLLDALDRFDALTEDLEDEPPDDDNDEHDEDGDEGDHSFAEDETGLPRTPAEAEIARAAAGEAMRQLHGIMARRATDYARRATV